MSNNHVESAKLHICSFIQLTFATLNEVMIYYNGNLSYLHAIHGESHMHSDARMHTNKHAIRSDWQQRGYESRHWRKYAYFFFFFFYFCRVVRGNDERRVMYLWEVSIDTTPAHQMTGLRSRVVVQGEARLSTWQQCNRNTVPSLKALGHCHHSSKDPCWRCFAVSRGSWNVTMIAVYRFELETDRYRKVLEQEAETIKKRNSCSSLVLFHPAAVQNWHRSAEPKKCAGWFIWR